MRIYSICDFFTAKSPNAKHKRSFRLETGTLLRVWLRHYCFVGSNALQFQAIKMIVVLIWNQIEATFWHLLFIALS